MKIKELKEATTFKNKRLADSYQLFDRLLVELRKKALSDEVLKAINNGIDKINSVSVSEKALRKQINKTQSHIIKLIEKEHKLVTKNHYRNTWLAVGMSAFGIPIGLAFGASLGSMAYLGIGLPIGMVIGMAVGTSMDNKAFNEGRQLDLEL